MPKRTNRVRNMLNACERGHAVVSPVQPQENLALPSRDLAVSWKMRTLQRWSPRNKTHIKKMHCLFVSVQLPYMCALLWTVQTCSVCRLYDKCMFVSRDLKLQSREKMLSQPHGEKQWQFSSDNKTLGAREANTKFRHLHITHRAEEGWVSCWRGTCLFILHTDWLETIQWPV